MVGPATPLRKRELGLQRVEGHRLRIGVRHLHEAGDAAGHRGARLGGHIGLVGQARVAKMHLVVDHAGHEREAGGIDHLCVGRADLGSDLLDASVDDQQVALRHLAFVHHAGIANQQLAHQS